MSVRELIAGVLRKRAELAVRAPPNVELEAEVRLGVCAGANGERVRSADEVRQFASNIGGTHFFATFEELAARADVVSASQLSTHHRYAEEVVPASVRSERQNDVERWTAKRVLDRHDVVFRAWFDIRASLSEERRVAAPTAVLEARQMAQRIRTPWQQPRTRLGVPKHTRRRIRRSLQFRDALAWRIDFTCVETSRLVRGASAFVGGPAEYQMHNDADDTLEIELEYVGDVSMDVDVAVEQVMHLLARLATALGRSAAEVRQRTQRRRQQAEMANMSAMFM